jgi:SAM-dependent methyltransferase
VARYTRASMSDMWERQRRSFDGTADAYDRHRPSYPAALFDDIKDYADLAPDDAILEIGAGTGRATVPMAEWGNPLTAVEPSAAMADVARTNLKRYANVEVITSSFEEAGITPRSFGLVTCAQAWHWLDEATRIERTADALYHFGTAAIIANVQVNPEETLPFFVRVQDVYREHAPEMMHAGEFRKHDDLPGHPLEGATQFSDLEQRAHAWEWTLSSAEYIGLMSTHSNHAALDPPLRERLLSGVAELIDTEFGGSVTEHYVAMVALAHRA